MKSGRKLQYLGDAAPDPELDARLEAMEDRAEADLTAGRLSFKWVSATQPARRKRWSWTLLAGVAVLGLVWQAIGRRTGSR